MTTPSDAERQRLATLRRYRILDTPPEEGFDRLARVARALLDAPVALVSLTDLNRQWFKSCYGLDARQSDRETAFCPYAVAAREVLYVPDLAADERFRDNPLVTGPPYLRAYCGAPLFARDGTVPGTLCVMDSHPRADITDQQIQRLRDLAAAVSDYMEHRHGLEQARREEAQLTTYRELLDTIYENLALGVALADAQGYINHANRTLADLAGVDVADLAGTWIDDWLERASEGTLLRCRGGELVPIAHSAEPVELSGHGGFHLHTIADRRTAERELTLHRGRAHVLKRITEQLDPGETLRELVGIAASLDTAGAAFLYLHRDPDQRPMVVAPELEALGYPGYLERVLGELDRTAREAAPAVVPLAQALSDPEPLRRPLRCEAVALQHVVLHDGTRTGTLGIFLGHSEDSDGLRAELTELAKLASIALGHSDMLGRLRWGAYHDELTGLANQRLLQRRFVEARDQARQAGEHLAILVVDLNGFKAINERFGYGAGDEILRRVATVLSGSMRGTDVVARTGGDEFVVLASIPESSHVRALASKVVDLIAAVPAPEGTAVSGSAGVMLDEQGADFEDLIAEADAAMYSAKQAGGHQWQPARPELS